MLGWPTAIISAVGYAYYLSLSLDTLTILSFMVLSCCQI